MNLSHTVLFLFLGIELSTVSNSDDPIDLSRGSMLADNSIQRVQVPVLLDSSVDLNQELEQHVDQTFINQPIDLSVLPTQLVNCCLDTKTG